MLNYKKIFSLKPFDLIQKDKEKWYFRNQIKLCNHHYKKCKEYKFMMSNANVPLVTDNFKDNKLYKIKRI